MNKIKQKVKEVLHIYNVSIKNNKSLETIKQFLKSITELFDLIIIEYLEKNNLDVPDSPLKRLNTFLNYVDDEKIKNILEEYKIWRKCINSEMTVINEFRRNIKVICKLGENEYYIDQKTLKEILEKTKEFYNYMKPKIWLK